MTVPAQDTRVTYTASGSSDTFAYPFRILSSADLLVYVDDVLQTLTTDYTVTGVDEEDGGNVVFVDNPAADSAVVIMRDMDYGRTAFDYQTSGSFRAETINRDLDSLALQIQQLAEKISRAPLLSVATVLAGLAFPSPGAGQYIRWNDAGTALQTAAQPVQLNYQTIGVSIFEYFTDEQIEDVLTRGEAVDVSAAVRDAISSGKPLRVPAGTYMMRPDLEKVWEGSGTMLCAVPVVSGMTLLCEPGTVWKIPDEVSTDTDPKQMAMFFSNEVFEDVYIENLTVDMNGANNLISPSRGSGTYNRYNQAHFHVSGTISGTAARGENVQLVNCKFINTPGASCIVMQQTNTSGLTLSKNWQLVRCQFENNGFDTDDHSSIFGWADDVQIIGCRAVNSTMFDGTGGNVFYECHGANHIIYRNIVENYNQFSWCATNNTSDTQNVIYANNIAKVRENGTAFYRLTTSTGLLRKVKIHGDIYNLTDDDTAVPLKYGVLITGGFANAAVSDIDIENVLVTKVGTDYASAAVGIGAAATNASQKHTRIHVKNCGSIGTNRGVLMWTNATNGLGEIHIQGGVYQTLPSTVYADGVGVHIGVSGSNTIDAVVLGGVHFDGSNNGMHRGVYMEGSTITDLHMTPCTYQGMITANYSEGTATVTRRHGIYPMLPYTPVLSAGGTAVTVGNATRDAYYKKYDEECRYRARFIVGSTTSFGAGGALSFALPLTAATSGSKYIGHATIIDSGTGTRYMHQVFIDGTGTSAHLQKDGGTLITSGDPITIGTGDEIYIDVVYRVAD